MKNEILQTDLNKFVNVRAAYAKALIQKAKHRKDFFVLDCDSKEPTKMSEVYHKYPEICFSFGIAEQNMVSAAAGMATLGVIPFVNTFAQFISMRALDQVRNSIAYPNLNVKLVVCHYGLDVGKDGATHQTIEDISIMRSIPNIVILNPADDIECQQMVDYCFEHNGPVYLRTGKSPVPRIHKSDYIFKLGAPDLIRSGKDNIPIIASGNIFQNTLKALNLINAKGVYPQVINLPTLKPIDEDNLLTLTERSEVIFTIEDHNIYGGLGSIISEIYATKSPKKIIRIGVNDTFAEAGETFELYEKYGLGVETIVRKVMQSLD